MVSTKHARTLAAIFAKPTRANIKWRDIEVLFGALGAEVVEAEGSRLLVELNGVVVVFHRPHPRPDTDKGALVSVRKFLTEAGIGP